MPAAVPSKRRERDVAEPESALLRRLVSDARPALSHRIETSIPADIRALIDAEDVLQEAFIDLWRHGRCADSARDSSVLRRWLVRVAMHRLRDAVRIQRAAKRGGAPGSAPVAIRGADPPVAEETSMADAPDEGMLEKLHSILLCLPSAQRRALQLVFMEGRTLNDAAQVMERTPAAVRTLCYKARKALRAGLEAWREP